MTKKDKIIACYGNVRPKSIALMVGCSVNYVHTVLCYFCRD